MKKAVINFPKRFKQGVAFEGLEYKYNIRPTDIDMSVDFGYGKAYIFVDFKHAGKKADKGQATHLSCLVRDLVSANKNAIALLAEHDTPANKLIQAKNTIVIGYCTGNKWKVDSRGINLRKAIERYLNKIGFGEYNEQRTS